MPSQNQKKPVSRATRVLHAARTLRQEAKKHTSTAILTAFAIIIALAWKDVISGFVNAIVERLKGLGGAEAAAKMAAIYNLYIALIITVVCVIGMILISRWAGPDQK